MTLVREMRPPANERHHRWHWVRRDGALVPMAYGAAGNWHQFGGGCPVTPSQAAAYGWTWLAPCEPPHDGLQDRGA